MIRHIFFDLDNTLWDHRKNAYLTIKDLFEQHNIQETYAITLDDFHDVYYEINESLWEKLRDNLIDKEYLRTHRFYDTFMHFGVDDMALSQAFEVNFLDNILQYNELLDGAKEVLDYLQGKGYYLHIISNGFQEVTERKCILSGIAPYFKTITSADSVGVRKPDSRIFDYSMSVANADKLESILIGDDWIADVKGAKDYGMEVIYFNALGENLPDNELKYVERLLDLKSFL